jgi:hypothetical protein
MNELAMPNKLRKRGLESQEDENGADMTGGHICFF